MAEQYLHGDQEGEARVVPGLSGPATVEGGYPWTCGLSPRRKMSHSRPRVKPTGGGSEGGGLEPPG